MWRIRSNFLELIFDIKAENQNACGNELLGKNSSVN
jgi:hypothetical protein